MLYLTEHHAQDQALARMLCNKAIDAPRGTALPVDGAPTEGRR